MMKAHSRHYIIILIFLTITLFQEAIAGQKSTYRLPPDEILKLVDTPAGPMLETGPRGKRLMMLYRPNFCSIEDLAQPELRLAGLRINPRTNGPSRNRFYSKITIKNLGNKKEYPVTGLPGTAKISDPTWSPDGQKIAFTLTRPGGIELWVARASNGKAVKLTDAVLNNALRGEPFTWLPGGEHLLYRAVPANRGTLPTGDPVPGGPVIQDNEGDAIKAPVRTYQDLLQNPLDEKLFTHLATGRLWICDLSGNKRPIGKPGIISRFIPSPDGKYIYTEIITSPFSYLVPYHRFPKSLEIWDMEGKLARRIARIPLSENMPRGFDAVRPGPRSIQWRSDAPAGLWWVEAQDEGDPGKDVETRDRLFFLNAPFTGEPGAGPALKSRYRGIEWGRGTPALITQRWRKTRREVMSLFNPDRPQEPARVIFDHSYEDRYQDPGDFITIPGPRGKYILLSDKSKRYYYLVGRGASPEGNRPFLDRFEILTGKIKRLWRSKAPYYETLTSVIDIDKHKVLLSRESKSLPPNYYLLDLKKGKSLPITQFPHPFPQLKNVEKRLLKYYRKDGVELSGTLYLPPGYTTTEGSLPLLIWAYPLEYKSKSAAGQVSASPYRFTRPSWREPMIWVTQGYAVLDNAAMPIVGEGEKEPNDTYVEQLTANAAAAIDSLVEMGIADRGRVAIAGHSYGAFMTANLLAHSRLFVAGIARSGAYNRTLTPFGFQAEERTLWEALDTYIQMSPFMHAHKIKDPILLIHGELDNNSGTFPVQSKRFYHALKGHGAKARLVMLPYESHGYRARESVLHVLWETFNWLEKYVKAKK